MKSGRVEDRALKGSRDSVFFPATICLALVLVLLAYWPALGFFFELEDWGAFQRVADRPTGLLGFWASELENYFRPVEWIYYDLSYALFSTEAYPHYLASLLHQVLNSLLVYVFVRTMRGDRLLASFSAILFAVYPTAWEAVTWVVAVGHQLVVTNMLLSFIFAARYFQTRAVKYYFGLLIFFILSLCTREQSIMALPTIVMIHVYFLERPVRFSKELRPYIPLLPLYLAYGIYQLVLQQSNKMVVSGKYGVNIDSIINWVNINFNMFIPNKVAKAVMTPEMIVLAKSNWILVSLAFFIILPLVFGSMLYSSKTRVGMVKIVTSRFTYFSACFVALHLLVYSLFVGGGSASSRYTYEASIGASMLIAMFFASYFHAVASTRAKAMVSVVLLASLAVSVVNIRLGIDTFRERTNTEESSMLAFEEIFRESGAGARYHFINPPYVGYAWNRAISIRFGIPLQQLSADELLENTTGVEILGFNEDSRKFYRCLPVDESSDATCLPQG